MILNFTLNTFQVYFQANILPGTSRLACWIVTNAVWYNVAKCFAFQIFCIVLVLYSSSRIFPYPYNWIFDDLRYFLFYPKFSRVFIDFLGNKGEDVLENLTICQNCIINKSDSNWNKLADETLGTRRNLRTIFEDSLHRLKLHFDDFKKTKAFARLCKKVSIYEEVMDFYYRDENFY